MKLNFTIKKIYALRLCVLVVVCLNLPCAKAQLVVNGGLVIEAGATVKVAGSVTLQGNISGAGFLECNGVEQNLDAQNNSIPNLRINNGTKLTLQSACAVSNTLDLLNGKIWLQDFSLLLTPAAVFINASANGYVVTNALGTVQKQLNTVATIALPTGSSTSYLPINFTPSSITGTAVFAARFVDSLPTNQSAKVEDCLQGFWRSSYQNANGVVASTKYTSQSVLKGFPSFIKPIVIQQQVAKRNANATIDTVLQTLAFGEIANEADLTATNTFVWVTAKAILQGAYSVAAGKMLDNLRTPTNLIPLTDPYRESPYRTNFLHANNSSIERVLPALMTDQPNTDDNIVDWVFIELRNASYVLQGTRSALLKRSGQIIDVDGSSAVFFKNVDSGNFVITVRHRNHLGVSIDANAVQALGLSKPTITKFDLSTLTDTELFGNANAFATSTDGKRMLWGGNANSNTNIRYSGPSNDNAFLLSSILGGTNTLILSNVYSAGDVNMNRNVRYSGPGNDNAFLLSTVLGGVNTLLISQQIPN